MRPEPNKITCAQWPKTEMREAPQAKLLPDLVAVRRAWCHRLYRSQKGWIHHATAKSEIAGPDGRCGFTTANYLVRVAGLR